MGTAGEGHALLDYAVVAFGYRYRSAAIVGAPADDRPALAPAELTGQPGARASNVWLERDGARLSTVDLFGRGSVLVRPDGFVAWRVERPVVDPARVLSAVLLELLAREQAMAAAR